MSASFSWIWSGDYQNYYYYDSNGVAHWATQTPQAQQPQQIQQAPQAPYVGSHTRVDSRGASEPDMAPPVPWNYRPLIPNLMSGTPERGWYDPLDPSYRMRTGSEAHQFFKKGRVFSMLWAEAASETLARNGTENTAITVGRFGQYVYSQIRRFVIVQVPRGSHFVYACGISTYTGRGVMKPGCNPFEHTIVHPTGTAPQYIAGEYQAGMTKEPIQIDLDEQETLDPASRLRFGKIFPVEWNVKVKNIGKVTSRDMPKLLSYYQDHSHNSNEYDSDENEYATYTSN